MVVRGGGGCQTRNSIRSLQLGRSGDVRTPKKQTVTDQRTDISAYRVACTRLEEQDQQANDASSAFCFMNFAVVVVVAAVAVVVVVVSQLPG